MEDFKYIISWLIVGILMSNYGDKWPLIYGYLMKHQHCWLIDFSAQEVVNILEKQLEDEEEISINQKEKEITISNTTEYSIPLIEETLAQLCIRPINLKFENNKITFNIKSIFSDEEIESNRKRFEADC